jgi:hypothetical protein
MTIEPLRLPDVVANPVTSNGATMTKPIESWRDTYSPAELAQKYGLTIEQARIVISSNGPSRHGCEMGAQAFRLALKLRKGRQPSRHRTPV